MGTVGLSLPSLAVVKLLKEILHKQEPYQSHLVQTDAVPRRRIYTSPNDTSGAIYLVTAVV